VRAACWLVAPSSGKRAREQSAIDWPGRRGEARSTGGRARRASSEWRWTGAAHPFHLCPPLICVRYGHTAYEAIAPPRTAVRGASGSYSLCTSGGSIRLSATACG
jgi:hypothetical protein